MLCALIRSFSADTSCLFSFIKRTPLVLPSYAVFPSYGAQQQFPVVVFYSNNRIDNFRRFLFKQSEASHHQFGGFSASEHAPVVKSKGRP
jgi:hypothetical protein